MGEVLGAGLEVENIAFSTISLDNLGHITPAWLKNKNFLYAEEEIETFRWSHSIISISWGGLEVDMWGVFKI